MSQDEFFAWQEKQDRLYEFVDGIPILPLKMMTGASQAHDRAAVNIIAALHSQLRGGPCRPTTDDLAARIPAGNVRRPDVTVECGQADRRELAVRDPRVVIEVLSPSTMSFDRFKKVLEYQSPIDSTHSAGRYRGSTHRCADPRHQRIVDQHALRGVRRQDRTVVDQDVAEPR
jgi:Uma2 family endonuclease